MLKTSFEKEFIHSTKKLESPFKLKENFNFSNKKINGS
jgi:hypothetical protein